jgi:hypothetical protein
MHIEANIFLSNSSYTMNYGGFIWSMSNLYCTGMLLSRQNYISLLNVEDTNVLIVTYVAIQNQGFSITTPTYASEARRHKFPHCSLCYCSDPDSVQRHLRPYRNHEDTHVLIEAYVTVQTECFSIKTPTSVSESWRSTCPHWSLCYYSDPLTQQNETYVRIWIMKAHISSM